MIYKLYKFSRCHFKCFNLIKKLNRICSFIYTIRLVLAIIKHCLIKILIISIICDNHLKFFNICICAINAVKNRYNPFFNAICWNTKRNIRLHSHNLHITLIIINYISYKHLFPYILILFQMVNGLFYPIF